MRRKLWLVVPCVLVVALGAQSCGSSASGDQTTKFVGSWAFSSGSLSPTCIGQQISSFDLTGLPVEFTKVDDATISLAIGTGCTLMFHASGNSASVEAGQTCTLDLGDPLGMQSIMVTKWTLVVSGDEIDATIAGTASVCTAAGTGVLARRATDGGAGTGGDGGGAGAGGSGGATAGTDGGAGGGGADGGAGVDGASTDALSDADGETEAGAE
jgi:hypothetical protein